MRRFASRFLLVGLVGAIIVFLIVRADERGGTLASIESISAEGEPIHRAFRVDEAMRVAIEASGSFETGGGDSTLAAQGWLVHRETGRVVWRMRPAERPARGSYVLMRDTLALAPGTYDAVYAALGDPLVRQTRSSGDGIGARFNDFLSSGGRGWLGDSGRWRFIVTPAAAEDRERAHGIDSDWPDDPEGLVWSSGAARSRTEYGTTLRATAPVTVRLDAVFEATGGSVADSAFVLSASGDTLWVARGEGSEWAGGSIKNRRQSETLRLEPGLYRVAFHTDRDHASGSWTANPPWEPWKWGLRIAPADSAAASGAIAPLDPLQDFPRIAEIACAGEDADERVRFEVVEALDVLVVGVGEIVGGTSYDYGTLSRFGEVIWDMRTVTTMPAGGDEDNRRAEQTLTLQPGTYSLAYRTDDSHHCGDFNRRPPDVEDFWGVVVLSADGNEPGDRVRLLAPEAAPASGGETPTPPGEILASLTQIGDNREASGQFTLSEPTDVCVMSLGEITDSRRSDAAFINGDDGGLIWEMTYADSQSGGGADDNRLAVTRLRLEPGRYTARFITDGSHAWGDFTMDEPTYPDLWGVQVWATPEADDDASGVAACVLPGIAFDA